MRISKVVLGVALSAFTLSAAFAQSLTPAQQESARTKVETAVALAEIARAEKDGEALAVAARLLAGAGPVVRKGEKPGQSTALYSIEELAAEARSMGASEAMTQGLTGPGEQQRGYCYWYYNCDSNNNCQWQYIC